MQVTILTPTYNRKDNLMKLYKSLCKQTNKNFTWMIVDDGSTDETKALANNFIDENIININYISKKNGGKHTAINLGIKIINSELTFIVDSDDWLDKDAVSEILYIHNKYKYKPNICGYSFLRKFPDGEINGNKFSDNELIGSYIDIRINSNDMEADKAEVWKTECLREYPFPVFEGEIFLGEDVAWIPMSIKYQMVHINKAIYIGQYLEGGLTRNRRINNIKAPIGCYNRSLITLNTSRKVKMNYKYICKNILQYYVYGKFGKITIKDRFKNVPYKKLYILFIIPGQIIYMKWKSEIRI